MNWEAIAAVSEMVGAVAVIITLGYLAVQLRQNTKAITVSSLQDMVAGMMQVSQVIATDPLIPAMTLKAVEGIDKLTAEEKVRWGALMLMAFRRLEVAFLQLKHGATTHDLIRGLERSLLLMLATKGGSEWWQSAKPVFNEKFVNHIEESLRSSEYVDARPVQFNIGE